MRERNLSKKIKQAGEYWKCSIAILSLWILVQRVLLYATGKGFFVDEVNLLRNFQERNIGGIWQPLDYDQHAPILFSILTEGWTTLFGFEEYALRLLPLLIGMLALLFWWKLLDHLFKIKFFVFIGLLLLGFNVVSLQYGLTYKQYIVDFFCSITLVWITLANKRIGKNFLLWTGLTAIFLSMPSIFVLAGIGLYLWLEEGKLSKPLWLMGLLWILAFSINYLIFLQPSVSSIHLQAYHSDFFLGWEGNNITLSAIFNDLVGILRGVFGKTGIAIGGSLLLMLFGLWKNHKKPILILFVFPIIATLFASIIKCYALPERLVFFLYPSFVMIFLLGAASLQSELAKIKLGSYLGLGLVTIMVLAMVSRPARFLFLPDDSLFGSEVKKGLEESLANFESHESLVVSHYGYPFITFYRDKLPPINIMHKIKWDFSDLHFIERETPYLLFDAHTWGREKKLLMQRLNSLDYEIIYENQDMALYRINISEEYKIK